MLLTKLGKTAATACAVASLAAGLGVATRATADRPPDRAEARAATPAAPVPAPLPPSLTRAEGKGGEPWRLTLDDAIRITLDNAKGVRVLSLGVGAKAVGGFEPPPIDKPAASPGPLAIAPLGDGAHPQRFKAEVMAEVRSVTQQYRALALAYVHLWAHERTVALADEILKRERSELMGDGHAFADVAEVEHRLDQFRLDLATRTSDVITAERHLRMLMGLPRDDDRKILPITPPTEAQVNPEWDAELARMFTSQPDIVRGREALAAAESEAAAGAVEEVASVLVPVEAGPRGFTAKDGKARENATRFKQQTASLKQVVHQTTHSLARFFLEVDANYKQFQTASRYRAAASQRLEAQRAFYEQGRITVDRYLDAVSQYASAVAQEAQYKVSYNNAITSLEEAKGTLLEFNKIAIAAGPRAVGTPRRDDSTTPAALTGTAGAVKSDAAPSATNPVPVPPAPDTPAPVAPAANSGPVAFLAAGSPAPVPQPPTTPKPAPPETQANPDPAPAAGKTVAFRFNLGLRSNPFEIRGELTITPARPTQER